MANTCISSLLESCQWTVARFLLNNIAVSFDNSSWNKKHHLLFQLSTEAYHAVTPGILDCLVKKYPSKLTDELLVLTIPPDSAKLELKQCSCITHQGLENALKRCFALWKLDLTDCDHLVIDSEIIVRVISVCPSITHLSLEKCKQIDDEAIKGLLKHLPLLKHLGLSGCRGVTDDVFCLHSHDLGLSQPAAQATASAKCQVMSLTSVDISYCLQLTAKAVWYLTELCGTTLRHLNLSGTSVDPCALAYLCGFTVEEVFKWITDESLLSYVIDNSVYGGLCLHRKGDTCSLGLCDVDSRIDDFMDIRPQMGHTCISSDVQNIDTQDKYEEAVPRAMSICLNCEVNKQEKSPYSSSNGRHVSFPNSEKLNLPDNPPRRYHSDLLSLDISNISFSEKKIGCRYLTLLLICNPHLQRFSTSWRDIDDGILAIMECTVASSLRQLAMIECDAVTSDGVGNFWKKCSQLQQVNLRGMCNFSESGLFPLFSCRGSNLRSLLLPESTITDMTLSALAEISTDQLEELDISWCEEVTAEGLEALVTQSNSLRHLSMRQGDTSPHTWTLLAHHCPHIISLNVSSVTNLDDGGVITIAASLHLLQQLDISWNVEVTDQGIHSLLQQCSYLTKCMLGGLRRLTISPFLPIIPEHKKWKEERANTMLVIQQVVLGKKIPLTCSKRGQLENILMSSRSFNFAPRLSYLDLEYCDAVDDQLLADIVAFCNGSLQIWDYYKSKVIPSWSFSEDGNILLPS